MIDRKGAHQRRRGCRSHNSISPLTPAIHCTCTCVTVSNVVYCTWIWSAGALLCTMYFFVFVLFVLYCNCIVFAGMGTQWIWWVVDHPANKCCRWSRGIKPTPWEPARTMRWWWWFKKYSRQNQRNTIDKRKEIQMYWLGLAGKGGWTGADR